MTTMMAARFTTKGTFPRWIECDMPVPTAGEALIKLTAAALNRRDFWITQGQYPGVEPPHILGSDGVGTLESLGDDTQSSLQPGQRVLINPGLFWGENDAYHSENFQILGVPKDGTLAQYVTVPVASLSPCPDHLSDAEAAALPLAGVTAYRALFTRATLKPSEKVLITGLGGGVSSLGVLFAKAMGAKVFGTSGSDEKLEVMRETADVEGFNYKSETWVKELHQASGGVDVILDGSGGQGFKDLLKLLRPGGRVAFYGGTCGKWPEILPQHLFYRQVSIVASTMGSPRDFEAMLKLVSQSSIKPLVWKEFEAEAVADAFAALETHAQLGKVVVKIPH